MAADALRLDNLSHAALAALPVAIYTTDAEGTITFCNEAAARFWGRVPEIGKEKWTGAHKLFHPDGTPRAVSEGPMSQALKTGAPAQPVEAMLERPDGSQVWFRSHPTPLHDANGKLVGAVNLILDITEGRNAERSQADLSAIVESSDDAILSKGLDGVIRSWNKGAERIFGYTASEAIGQPVLMLIPPDRHQEEPAIIARIRKGERVDHFETVRRHKDGTLMDISLTISPVKDKNGNIIGASKIARDISDRIRAEESKDLLLHEIKHRVKNTLGTVQAIATQTFRGAPREEREAFGARLRALSEAHDLLTNQDWGQVAAGQVVARAVAPFNAQRFVITGDTTSLPAATALLLAMVVHELCTNAVKYGALSNTTGTVQIGWQGRKIAPDKAGLTVRWQESGGPTVAAPSSTGFGTNLIQRALAGEQGSASFDYAPDGLRGVFEIRY